MEKDVKRNYKVGDLVTIKNGDNRVFVVTMNESLGIFLETLEGDTIRGFYQAEDLSPKEFA
jgi:hypothetical protein